MNQHVEQLRRMMIEAAAGARRTAVAIDHKPVEGLTPQQLGDYQSLINSIRGSIHATTAQLGLPASAVLMAVASALGAVLAEIETDDRDHAATITSRQVLNAFNQMRGKP